MLIFLFQKERSFELALEKVYPSVTPTNTNNTPDYPTIKPPAVKQPSTNAQSADKTATEKSSNSFDKIEKCATQTSANAAPSSDTPTNPPLTNGIATATDHEKPPQQLAGLSTAIVHPFSKRKIGAFLEPPR